MASMKPGSKTDVFQCARSRQVLEQCPLTPGARAIAQHKFAPIRLLFSSTRQDPHSGRTVCTGRKDGGLFHLEFFHVPPSSGPLLGIRLRLLLGIRLWFHRQSMPLYVGSLLEGYATRGTNVTSLIHFRPRDLYASFSLHFSSSLPTLFPVILQVCQNIHQARSSTPSFVTRNFGGKEQRQ